MVRYDLDIMTKYNLTVGQYAQLSKLCYTYGITASELIGNFLDDLTEMTDTAYEYLDSRYLRQYKHIYERFCIEYETELTAAAERWRSSPNAEGQVCLADYLCDTVGEKASTDHILDFDEYISIWAYEYCKKQKENEKDV